MCPGLGAPWDNREYITTSCPGFCGVCYKGATSTVGSCSNCASICAFPGLHICPNLSQVHAHVHRCPASCPHLRQWYVHLLLPLTTNGSDRRCCSCSNWCGGPSGSEPCRGRYSYGSQCCC